MVSGFGPPNHRTCSLFGHCKVFEPVLLDGKAVRLRLILCLWSVHVDFDLGMFWLSLLVHFLKMHTQMWCLMLAGDCTSWTWNLSCGSYSISGHGFSVTTTSEHGRRLVERRWWVDLGYLLTKRLWLTVVVLFCLRPSLFWYRNRWSRASLDWW